MPIKTKLQKIVRYITNPGLYRHGVQSAFRLSNLRDEPIIVCGAPRSGTTLLISILGSHKEIVAIPFETWLFVNKRANRWFKKEAWNRNFIFMQLKAFLLTLKVSRDHKRWCEKTPDNVLFLDFIFSVFNNKVKIIHIIRDGRDVVTSHHKKLGYFMTPQKWVKYVRAGLSYQNHPNVLTIQYENLVNDFGTTMAAVSDFLRIKNTFSEDFFMKTNVSDNGSIISGYGNKGLYRAKQLSTSSLFKWKEHHEVNRRFEECKEAKDLLIQLGYPISKDSD